MNGVRSDDTAGFTADHEAAEPRAAVDETHQAPPIVWSIAGTDSAGGAGLAADQRAADAFGVHLCPVVAAVTAQHSCAVTRVEPVSPALLEAQLAALEADLFPAAIKTGLLGGPTQVRLVAETVDRLRRRAPVVLVVDPVLGATTGASFADPATLDAYRAWLLPRATLVTPNRHEAQRLVACFAPHAPGRHEQAHATVANRPFDDAPSLALALRRLGAEAACVTGGDDSADTTLALDWLDTPAARGWLALPRQATPHHHGSGCTFATSAAAAMALGFVAADALVLAKMATAQALRHSRPAGAGAGPVRAQPGFATDPTLMPQLSWGEVPRFARFDRRRPAAEPLGLYAIADGAERIEALLAQGLRTLQLRLKPSGDVARDARIPGEVQHAVSACRAARARLFINDHHRLARETQAYGLHLGQEDLLALDEAERGALCEPGAPRLGISSHSLWELARARSLAPAYIACGPVWPTTTKAMPWRPQGPHNLAWWCAMAGAPVVAIGGILAPAQAREAAACGVDAVCLVRALEGDGIEALLRFEQAWREGRAALPRVIPALPRPSWAGASPPTTAPA